jgi:hypothetical protein
VNTNNEPVLEGGGVERFEKFDIVPLIERHAATGIIRNEIVGTSAEGRSIHHLTCGEGKTTILLWSQMHGDESTATMALFDLFNFFTARDDTPKIFPCFSSLHFRFSGPLRAGPTEHHHLYCGRHFLQ